MQTGPPRKPTALRVLQGNASHRPLNTAEPKPEIAEADVPPPMPMKGESLAIWQTMCPMLSKIGLLTICDLRALARYCDLFVRWVAARDFLDANGETYEVFERVRIYKEETKTWDTVEKSKGWINYPQVKNFLAYSRELVRLENELGLTPATRSRIQVEIFSKSAMNDAMAEYLASNTRKPLAG